LIYQADLPLSQPSQQASTYNVQEMPTFNGAEQILTPSSSQILTYNEEKQILTPSSSQILTHTSLQIPAQSPPQTTTYNGAVPSGEDELQTASYFEQFIARAIREAGGDADNQNRDGALNGTGQSSDGVVTSNW
jgi:hypothetical protein